uniref:Uncharacterized protein n=1 Tax=Chromera velia CCMP2878 TaxID=1169474 RepID=A0A0G4IBM3_9ALVE|eukprot:Cvel_2197.t1-p1 / transcript=Cvel_2197.t1 / gene=Cvel_2197 / organism=Chromera_velia_CCMP2878 / gene_product=hypothetical protein / transcript_product=hypothetical protein / location=Cvel_scaffold85:16102-16687(-) / protein_length=144 / sequence_SO=supercontig / SO=protein_coding / is_pseudo=false
MSYAQIASVIADVHKLEAQVRLFGTDNKTAFPQHLAESWWVTRHFALSEGILNEAFINQRLKQLSCGIWVLDLVQNLKDLLRMPAVKKNWRRAPLVDPNDPEPEDIRSIFDGDVYRKHPLVIEWSRRERERVQGVLQQPQADLI